MGKRGPRPKPTALRMLEGNPSNRALPKNEPKPPALQPSAAAPPRTLDRVGRAEWRRLAPQLQLLGLLTTVDLSALEICCGIYSELRQLRAQRRRWLRDKVRRDELWRVDSALDRKGGLYRQYLAEFGLTPAARTRVQTDEPPAPVQQPKPTGTEGKAAGRFFRE
jgi:P27 family predicted phage terminase small subunit